MRRIGLVVVLALSLFLPLPACRDTKRRVILTRPDSSSAWRLSPGFATGTFVPWRGMGEAGLGAT
jgi:hypothetical protein